MFTLLNILLPPRCANCGVICQSPGKLCSKCWQGVSFSGNPQCQKCGEPFVVEEEKNAACAGCPHKDAYILNGRSGVLYDDVAKHLILKFKHADRTDLAPLLASWMKVSYETMTHLPDYLVPVPLHSRRLMRRRYNQADLLAKALSKQIDVPVLNALKRTRATALQKEQDKYRRRKNVEGAFAVRKRYQKQLAGNHFMIIDDVWTTGATLMECSKTLQNAGAKDTSIMAVARVKNSVANSAH